MVRNKPGIDLCRALNASGGLESQQLACRRTLFTERTRQIGDRTAQGKHEPQRSPEWWAWMKQQRATVGRQIWSLDSNIHGAAPQRRIN